MRGLGKEAMPSHQKSWGMVGYHCHVCSMHRVKTAVDKPAPEGFKELIAGVSPQQGHSVQRALGELQGTGVISTWLSVLPDANCLSLDRPEGWHSAQALYSALWGLTLGSLLKIVPGMFYP